MIWSFEKLVSVAEAGVVGSAGAAEVRAAFSAANMDSGLLLLVDCDFGRLCQESDEGLVPPAEDMEDGDAMPIGFGSISNGDWVSLDGDVVIFVLGFSMASKAPSRWASGLSKTGEDARFKRSGA